MSLPPPNTTNRPSDWSIGHQRPHVLIVTDDPSLATFLGEGLVMAGFWTSVIASAFQVMEVFRMRAFDVAVVDADLGGIGATELVRRLRGTSERAGNGGARTDIPMTLIAATPDDRLPTLVADGMVEEIMVAPLEIDEVAVRLAHIVGRWREANPDRPYADMARLDPQGAS